MISRRIGWGERYSLGWKTIILGIALWLAIEVWYRALHWVTASIPGDSPLEGIVPLIVFLIVAPPAASFVYGFLFGYPATDEEHNDI